MKKIITKSLREQIYEYLKNEIGLNHIKKGEFININDISKKLHVSKTPLRDALLKLEADGFVEVFPRRGIKVNELTLDDIKDIYEIIGALECSVLSSIKQIFEENHLKNMKKFNEKMKSALYERDFKKYYKHNMNFHNEYLNLSNNKPLKNHINILKQRLYDFPPNMAYVFEWEMNSTKEHDKLLYFLEKGLFEKAGNFIKDVHWSFETQKKYIKLYYFKSNT